MMHRVLVAWDADEARRFLRILESHGISGRMIEDREFPERGELHDTEGAPEVWISNPAELSRAMELVVDFESKRRAVDAEPKGDGEG
jgi:hypothetical protein